MKLKSIFYGILGILCCMACTDDEKVTPRDEGFELRFEFPQGTNDWDKTAQEIQEKYGVYLIYKDIDSTHLRKTWTSVNSLYAGEGLTNDQAAFHIKFLKEHIFAYLPPKVTERALPIYYYLVYNYRNSTASTAPMMNTSNGIDYWVNSIFSKNQPTISTEAQYRECRYRMMRHMIENLYKHGNIVASKDFHNGFNYQTEYNLYTSTDLNYYLKRGFPGTALGDNMLIQKPPYSIKSFTPDMNFLGYINVVMLYTPEEFEAAYPKKSYSLIHTKRDYIVKYMKEKYKIDLEAIYRGPEL